VTVLIVCILVETSEARVTALILYRFIEIN